MASAWSSALREFIHLLNTKEKLITVTRTTSFNIF